MSMMHDEPTTTLMNDDSDLDYVAVFPPAGQHDPAAPAVLLFGWSGCRDQHLQKYAQLYDEHGCTTVRYTAPMLSLLTGDRGDSLARSLCTAVCEELDLASYPSVLVHSFSNNGARTLFLLLRALAAAGTPESDKLRRRITSVVFDSGPGDNNLWEKARAYVVSLHPEYSAVRHVITSCLYTLLFAGLRSWLWLRTVVFGVSADSVMSNFSWYTSWFDVPWAVLPPRQLYIYSKADHLANYRTVERFMALQRIKNGAQPQVLCFERSQHVDHLRSHRNEYGDVVRQIVYDAKKDPAILDASSTDDDENGFEKLEKPSPGRSKL